MVVDDSVVDGAVENPTFEHDTDDDDEGVMGDDYAAVIQPYVPPEGEPQEEEGLSPTDPKYAV